MNVCDLDLLVTEQILEDAPASPSQGKLCEDHGYSCEWTSGQKTTPYQRWQKIRCNTENHVPIVVPGVSTSSFSSTVSTSPTSLTQDSTEDSTSSPATMRRRSTRGDQLLDFEQSEGDSKDTDPIQGNSLRELTEWLEDFKENPVDEGVSATRDTPESTSRESDSESPRKVVSGRHRIFTHFTQRPKLRHLHEDPRSQGHLAGNALVMQYLEQKTLAT